MLEDYFFFFKTKKKIEHTFLSHRSWSACEPGRGPDQEPAEEQHDGVPGEGLADEAGGEGRRDHHEGAPAARPLPQGAAQHAARDHHQGGEAG